jgi:hypothetical protein
MIHHSGIDFRIGGCIFSPDTGKPVIKPQLEIGKGFVVKQVPIPVIEMIILIIPYFDHALFRPEGIPIIIPCYMMINFGSPSFQISSIEKWDPFFFGSGIKCKRNQDEQKGYH